MRTAHELHPPTHTSGVVISAIRCQVEPLVNVLLTGRRSSQRIGGIRLQPCYFHRSVFSDFPHTIIKILSIGIDLLFARQSVLTLHLTQRRPPLASLGKLPELPVELIQLIILLCVPTSFHKLPSWTEARDFRLHITQICTSWRKVAFNMPELWDVRVPTPAEQPVRICKASIKLIDSWFCQSSASYLGLTMIGSWETKVMYPSPLPIFDSALAKLVVPHARRFRSLGLLVMSASEWNILAALPFDSLTNLTLDLGCLSGIRDPGRPFLAPSLRHLQVNFISNVELLRNFPWKQLTSLTLSGRITIDEISDILSQSSLLESCELDRIRVSESVPSKIRPNGSIFLPNLNSLSVNFVSTPSLGWLSTLSTPRLSSLIIFTLPEMPETLHAFVGYISSISSTLRHFEVRENVARNWENTEIAPVELTLQAMPQVTHLFLSNDYPLCAHIMETIGVRELVPCIERFRFSGTESLSRVIDLLIPPRHTHHTTLKSITYSSILPGLDCNSSRVQHLIAQGVDIGMVVSY